MNWATSQTSAPALEPVTSTEAKLWCRVDVSDDDTIFTDIITAARVYVENVTRRQLITATWALYLDQFYKPLKLPYPPLQSISSIAYVDTAGATQTLASSQYQVDAKTQPGRLTEAYGVSWPSTRPDTYNAVTITYVAGYGTAASTVPLPIKQAMRILIASMYESMRSTVITGTFVLVPKLSDGQANAVDSLLWPYRIHDFGVSAI